MLSTTSYSFGDIVLLSFPFNNQAGQERRPAVVVSSGAYNRHRPDAILMAITSKVRQPPGFGEVAIDEWRAAGLIKPSAAKPVVFTAEKRIILKRLGQLKEKDQQAVRKLIESR